MGDKGGPQRAYSTRQGPAREFASGVFWLGGCSDTGRWGGKWANSPARRHVYTNSYLVKGDTRSLLVETGHSAHWGGLSGQLSQLLGRRPLDYVFPTHQEIPHCGNLPRLTDRYPDLMVVGDVSEYHLYYPSIRRDHMHAKRAGEALDLGSLRVEFVEPVWHDLPTTLWLWAEQPRVLFCVDGLQFSHDHAAQDCGKISNELSEEPPGQMIEAPAHDTIKWAAYSDMRGLTKRFRELVNGLQPRFYVPSHGAVISAESGQLLERILTTVEDLGRRLSTGST